MSLIDKHILESFFKKAQQTADYATIAKKLVSNLSNEFSGNSVLVSSDTPSELTTSNLQNLSELLVFLTHNQVKINGQRIIYSPDEYKTLSDNDKNNLYPIDVSSSFNQTSGKLSDNYYVNLTNLTSYVKYLQDKATSMKNSGNEQGNLILVMINKIVDQINEINPSSGLASHQSDPENPNVLHDDEVLDNFNSKIFDPKNPFEKGNSFPLKAQDVKSKEALNDWMQNVGMMAQVISYNGNNKNSLDWNDPKTDHCAVISILYNRARNAVQNAGAQTVRNANYYLKQMQIIGPTFSDPSGKACSVSTSSNINNSSNISGTSGIGKTPGSSLNSGTNDNGWILTVVSNLPLRVETLDFNAIDKFFQTYIINVPDATQWYNPATTYMDSASSLTIGHDRTFSLLAGPGEILRNLIPPSGDKYVPFLDQLLRVLDMTGKALYDLKSKSANTESGEAILKNFPDAIARINAQVLGGNSILANNMNHIQSLINSVKATSK